MALYWPKLALPDPSLLLDALFKHVLTPFFHCICIIKILLYYYIAVLFTVAIHEPTKSHKPSQPLQFICVNGFGVADSRPNHITIHPLALLLSPLQL